MLGSRLLGFLLWRCLARPRGRYLNILVAKGLRRFLGGTFDALRAPLNRGTVACTLGAGG